MSFSIKNTNFIFPTEQITSEKIEFDTIQLKQYGSKYLYNPGEISKFISKFEPTEKLVMDDATGKWILVKDLSFKNNL